MPLPVSQADAAFDPWLPLHQKFVPLDQQGVDLLHSQQRDVERPECFCSKSQPVGKLLVL
ncbi:hypothetical protein WT83_19295 [Burkholderia territorii]|uniref:Uncharacterized protein n=1 Tax=Burkholderia territorii TaxID=1503055 RepID=A0A106DR26_9BURK|nr:hypothetical protein WT31_08770 [Burkholderia territorii]KWN11739.1 hypothetical protein WT83_19295 [Burkholderia territorii]